jgi:N12 class adenine-specific DNA methylase/adenine-specific DNA methylase
MSFQTDLFATPANSTEPTSFISSAPANLETRNFHLTATRDLAKKWTDRAADNIAAIRLSNKIKEEKRSATTAEKLKLIKFIGFGATALATTLFSPSPTNLSSTWASLSKELTDTVSAENLDQLAKATQYAHYTPEDIARMMWEAAALMGFTSGTIVEPGCGNGLIIATAPRHIEKSSKFIGFEQDPTSATICQQLHPLAVINVGDYCRDDTPTKCDLVISNPPYSSLSISNRTKLGRLGLSLHEFFVLKSTNGLRAGGIAVFLISRYTMDKTDNKFRKILSETMDLVGAIRLPNGCMREAGTEVVADILIMRKRDAAEKPYTTAWLDTDILFPADSTHEDIDINRWFLENPNCVLGDHAIITSQYGPTYGCKPKHSHSLALPLLTRIQIATQSYLSEKPYKPSTTTIQRPASVITAATSRTAAIPRQRNMTHSGPIYLHQLPDEPQFRHLRNHNYVIYRGMLMQVEGQVLVPVEPRSRTNTTGIASTSEKYIRLLIPIRDAVRSLLANQKQDKTWAKDEDRLNAAYDRFVAVTGHPINHSITYERTDPETGTLTEYVRQPAIYSMRQDPDCWLLASIENYDANNNTATKGQIFTKRILKPSEAPTITNAIDALPITLRDKGYVDLAYLCKISRTKQADAIALLGDRIYQNPTDMTWETADNYLSGSVRVKLKDAITAAKTNPRFQVNVAALEKVQPRTLIPSEISANLGSPWLPTNVIETFVSEVLTAKTRIFHETKLGTWDILQGNFESIPACRTTWGTHRMHAGQILHHALNSKAPVIKDTIYDGTKNIEVLNETETEAAQHKLEDLQLAFKDWLWRDPTRAEEMVLIYNDLYNNLVPRAFDGSHLTLDDANLTIKFYDTQKRGIWRIITSGTTYIAQWMGSGKTTILIAAIMEQLRLGLVKKPMLICPSHVLNQFSSEFMKTYPLARILVANEDDMSKKNRHKFMSRAALESWDCIIVSESAQRFLGVPKEFEISMHREMIEQYIGALEHEGCEGISRKKLERAKESILMRIENLESVKDDLVTIAEMGIDQILVDEAHAFRKLSFATNRKNVKGIDPEGSQLSWGLYVKSRFTEQLNPGRGLILSSGTPITNTLAELYTVQRYMDPAALEERGVHNFDAWASTFGDMKAELEIQPDGRYKRVERFCKFVNLPELTAMFRKFADIVLEDELKHHVKLPELFTGARQIIACAPTEAFKEGQLLLADRIAAIEARKGHRPKPGEDIILSVLNDGRLLSVDPRTLNPTIPNDDETKLNYLIRNAFDIYTKNINNVYLDPATNEPMPLTGAAQMIFSDIAIHPSERRGNFSAYEWIRDELIRMGVPPSKIAFVHDYKTAAAKRRLFNAVNTGSVLFLLGSSARMGTGANAQVRLLALHHLDIPYLVAHVSQRECRIVRQGNQNAMVQIFAYVTTGSIDATMWQMLKRKAQFIQSVMRGDPRIREMDEDDDQIANFAYARAMASGDERLHRKAGLEEDIGRLERLHHAHQNNQFHIHRQISTLKHHQNEYEKEIAGIHTDLSLRIDTSGTNFAMTIGKETYTTRTEAQNGLMKSLRTTALQGTVGTWKLAEIGGFTINATGYWENPMFQKTRSPGRNSSYRIDTHIQRSACEHEIPLGDDFEAKGIGKITKIENILKSFEDELSMKERLLRRTISDLAGYEQTAGQPFEFLDELKALIFENAQLEQELTATTENKNKPTEPSGDDETADDTVAEIRTDTKTLQPTEAVVKFAA